MKKLAVLTVKLRFVFIVLFIIAAGIGVWLIKFTNVNYDMTEYLPEDSPTNVALKVMEDEFGNIGYLQVMVKDVSSDIAESLTDNLKHLDGVDSVLFDAEDEGSYIDNKALIKVYLNHNDFSEEASQTIGLVQKALNGYDTALSGYAVEAGYNRDMIKSDLKAILIWCLIVVFVILMLSSRSWADALVFLISLAVALLINIGTNALLNSISFVSQAVCAVLQIALAMDYSIIILHRYHEEREKTDNKLEAMRTALSSSTAAVAASSLTTIAGLCALMFMRFKIGLDIGVVLTKGIVCSLLASFFFLPAIILLFDGLLKKTAHKKLIPELKGLGSLAAKKKLWVPVLALLVFTGGYLVQQRLGFIYEIEVSKNSKVYIDRSDIDKAFGIQNPLILLVPRGDRVKEQAVIDYVNSIDYKGEELVTSGQGLVTTGLYDELTADEAAERFNTSAENLYDVYKAIGKEGEKALVYDVLKYLKESDYIDTLAQKRQTEADDLAVKVRELFGSLTSSEFSQKYGLDKNTAAALWEAQGYLKETELVLNDVLTFAHDKSFFESYAQAKQAETELSYNQASELITNMSCTQAASVYNLKLSEIYGIAYLLGAEGYDNSTTLPKAALIKYLYSVSGDKRLEPYYNSVIEAETPLTAEAIKSDMTMSLLFNDSLINALFSYYGLDAKTDTVTNYQILQFISDNQIISKYAPTLSQYQAVYDDKYLQAKELYEELTYKKAASTFGIDEQQAFVIYCLNNPKACATMNINGWEILSCLYKDLSHTELKDKYEAAAGAFTLLNKTAIMKQSSMYDEKTTEDILNSYGSNSIYGYQLLSYTLEHNLITNYGSAAQKELNDRYVEAAEAQEYLTAEEVEKEYGIDEKWALEIFNYYNIAEDGKIKKSDLALYASDNKLPIRIAEEERQDIDKNWSDAVYAIEKYEGDRYTRLIFNIAATVVSDEAEYVVKSVRAGLSDFYSDYYVLGSSVNICDIRDTFSTDMTNINILNIAAVFLIVMLLYRSISIPIILVACIQGAIFINLSINTVTHSPVYFVCYLVAICIQMGATIDYGILLTDRYCTFRRSMSVTEAIKEALKTASVTIMTSGFIFIIAAAIVGFRASVPIISYIGKLISQGAVVSVITVLFILPPCLCVLDSFLEKASIGRKFFK